MKMQHWALINAIIISTLIGCANSNRLNRQATNDDSLQCNAVSVSDNLIIRAAKGGIKIPATTQIKIIGMRGAVGTQIKILRVDTSAINASKNSRGLTTASPQHTLYLKFIKRGTYPITVTVVGQRGGSATCSSSVYVDEEMPPQERVVSNPNPPTEPPSTLTIKANNHIGDYFTHYNDDVTISWETTNVAWCRVKNLGTGELKFIGNPNSNSYLINGRGGVFQTGKLTEDTTYGLTCYKDASLDSQRFESVVRIEVLPAPQVNLTASSGSQINRNDGVHINFGDNVILRWNSNESVKTNGCSFLIEQQNGQFSPPQPGYAANGQISSAPPPKNVVIHIKCFDDGGNLATDHVGIAFNPPTVNLTADSTDINFNTSTRLRWTSRNAVSCTGPHNNTNHAISGNVATGNLTNHRTYNISCVGPGSELPATDSVRILVQLSCSLETFDHNSCHAPGRISDVAVFTPRRTSRVVAQNTYLYTARTLLRNAAGHTNGLPNFWETCKSGFGVVPSFITRNGRQIRIRTNNNLGSAECPVAFTAHATPLIIDVLGEGISLTAPNQGVYFDIKAEGSPVLISWVDNPRTAMFLVYDKNSNGLIDDGNELFGDHTMGPDGMVSTNGFDALAKYDANKDGLITSEDPIYSQLQVWSDMNKNGISEGSELFSLSARGISKIDLKYQNVEERNDFYGNMTRQRSVVELDNGELRAILDIYFVFGI